jgi:L-ascorbate metabolism protein UlaG (beta-lactamase superfamily)
MQFTFYGHACFSIASGGKRFLFDPFISGNPLAKDIDVNSIAADYILVSHAHVDHTADLLSIAKRTGAIVIGAWEVTEWVKKHGYENVHPMNFGRFSFPFGDVRFVQAAHSSSFADGTYGGSAGGFIVKLEEGCFYYTGDTGLMLDFQLIPNFAKPDFTIMPIGGNFTMDVADAVIAAGYIQCSKIIGVHYDTFGYIVIDKELAMQQFANAGKELLLPQIGETITL